VASDDGTVQLVALILLLRESEIVYLEEGLDELIEEAEETLKDHQEDPILTRIADASEAMQELELFLETIGTATDRLAVLKHIREQVKRRVDGNRQS